MKKLNLDIHDTLELNYGITLEEIAHNLQRYTDKYLYIDDNFSIKFVDKMEELNYQNCICLDPRKFGYLLYEEETDRLLHVFHSDLKEYLIRKISDNFENDMTDSDKIKEHINEKTCQEYITKMKIYIRNVNDEDCLEAMPLNNDLLEKIEKDKSIDLAKSISLSFTVFLDLQGYKTKVYLYNQNRNFSKEVEVVIISDKEISIESIKEIEDYAVLSVNEKDIIFFIHISEDTESDDNSDLSFDSDCRNNKDTYLLNNEDLKRYEETTYSYEVPLERLPVELREIVLKKIQQVLFYNDTVTFYFQNGEFVIKNEGAGLYSLFDKDLIFYLSHLHPSSYYNAYEYRDLPVAQFFYDIFL